MCFWDSDFPFRRLDKRSTDADSRKEKKKIKNVCREIIKALQALVAWAS